jgi:hypothetical protein
MPAITARHDRLPPSEPTCSACIDTIPVAARYCQMMALPFVAPLAAQLATPTSGGSRPVLVRRNVKVLRQSGDGCSVQRQVHLL